MKGRRFLGLILAVLLLCSTTAYATGGTASDPLVSLDYLNHTYQNDLIKQVADQVERAVSLSYQRAVSQLEAGGGVSNVASKRCSRGDQITLSQGSVVILTAGTAQGSAIGGVFIDATTGTEAMELSLKEGHRYLVSEGATATIMVRSDAAAFFWEGESVVQASGEKATHFTDLLSTEWYYTSACYAYVQGLFTGVSSTTFAPHSPVTRAMMATVLYRMADQPETSGNSSFTDVPQGQWYSDSVAWAEENGVANGVGDGQFNPDGKLTREQMAVMLRNYASRYLQADVSASDNLNQFADKETVSDWAKEAMGWAVSVGILTGRDNSDLDPGGEASRAEASAMLRRFRDALK